MGEGWRNFKRRTGKNLDDLASSMADVKGPKINMQKTPLEPIEIGILELLGRKQGERKSAKEITDLLISQEFIDEGTKVSDVRKKIYEMIEKGYVQGNTYGLKDKTTPKYGLTGYVIGGGTRRKMEEQGRNFLSTSGKTYKRWFGKTTGAFFTLVGLGVFIYEGIGMTGAAVSSGAKLTPGFILGFALFVVGIALLELSFKKKVKKNKSKNKK